MGKNLDFAEAVGEEKDDKAAGYQLGQTYQQRKEKEGKCAMLSGKGHGVFVQQGEL